VLRAPTNADQRVVGNRALEEKVGIAKRNRRARGMEGRGQNRACYPTEVSMLNRPLFGLVAGALLGVFDGLSALVSSPEVAGEIAGIVVGSTFKGLLAGLITGLIARRFESPARGLAVGTVVALIITLPIAHMNATHYGQPSYYWKIMLPGALVGAIAGFATVRYGRPAAARARA
jgi:hypothetical protein